MTDPAFRTHHLTPAALLKAAHVGEAFDGLLKSLLEDCPAGREMAIVKTKLEEACFFAKKSLAQVESNQARDPLVAPKEG